MCWKMEKEYFGDQLDRSVSIMFSSATVIVNML